MRHRRDARCVDAWWTRHSRPPHEIIASYHGTQIPKASDYLI
jgi:hypothetical protein